MMRSRKSSNEGYPFINPQIVIETTAGEIVVELNTDKAPLTSAFFMDLVARDHYRGGAIYRGTQLSIEQGPFLLQGGSALPYLQDASVGSNAPMLDHIETTGVTGIRHRRGTLSLARDLNRTGHALTEFFICLGDFPTLDEGGRNLLDEQGFPAFGKVVSALEILDEISTQETKGYTHLPLLEGQMLTTPISVEQIRILS
ncbi:MAG: peptidylprolyl isomerase [Pseudomonadaceae bacterium]|nr:peptidylprolyl isomerase [Pseudomonadaceae bacterium]